jgi:predicted nucleotidyltransferase
MIQREATLEILRQLKSEFEEQYGVTTLGLFGSLARREATETSDVDIVVCMKNPNLFRLVHVKERLEEALHQHVDIVHYRERMNIFLKNRIDQEAIYV